MDARQRPGSRLATKLQPPGPSHTAAAPADYRWLWAALIALLLLGLAVIFALPKLVAPVHESAVPAEPLPPAGDSTALRDTAHQTLQGYLQLRARLELENAAVWGEPDWSEAAGRVSTADRYFAQRQFAAAARDYREAFDRLQQLAAKRTQLLATALEEATRALAGNEVATASARFEAVLAIEPEHPAAVRGLAQASIRRAVLEQLNRGQAAETNSDPEAARAAYRQAVQLDADYEPARLALQRVAEQITGRDFTAAMTRTLAALDAGQPGAAGKALAEAEGLRPDATAVRNARQRLQGMRAQAGLNRLRRQAADKVSSEDWPGAVERYRKALAIDAAAGFARTGLQHAEERVKLHAQIDHYLEAPARLYSTTPLANAEQLLASASEAPADEPRLAEKITALQALVRAAGTPVTLTLNSDGATSVVVYRVGRLGQFESQRLELLPGDYTIVGKRSGYRDVRKVIAVRPGVPMQPLLVRCEEKI